MMFLIIQFILLATPTNCLQRTCKSQCKCTTILSVLWHTFWKYTNILWSFLVLLTWYSIGVWNANFSNLCQYPEFLDISHGRSWQNFSKSEQDKLRGKLDSAIFAKMAVWSLINILKSKKKIKKLRRAKVEIMTALGWRRGQRVSCPWGLVSQGNAQGLRG